jgi:phosphatidylglycerophosphate synthase
MKLSHKIPKALIFSRLLIGIILLFLAIVHVAEFKIYAVTLITIGLLTDVFDGIIARRLNISTEMLRRLDSSIDLIFWILILFSTIIQYPEFYSKNITKLCILLGMEAMTYAISFIKFKKEIATHAIASKIWTLIIFLTLIQLIVSSDSVVLFNICFYTGIITRMEIIVIILLLKKWVTDVPSFYHAILLRQNKPIKRSKLFNG